MAARRFCINEKLVRDWRKKRNDLSEMQKGKKAACGHQLMYHELEEKLAAWIEESCSQGLIITCTAIRISDSKNAESRTNLNQQSQCHTMES